MTIHFTNKIPGLGRHMDVAIQLAMGLAGLKMDLSDHYFERKDAKHTKHAENGWYIPTGNVNITKVLYCMLGYENEGGNLPKVAYKDIPPRIKMLFCKWTGQPEDSEEEMRRALLPLCPPHHVSLVKGLHLLMLRQAHNTMAIPEWKASEAGLRRAEAQQRGCAAGRAVIAARGPAHWQSPAGQNSLAGAATRAAGGWIDIPRGQRAVAGAERGKPLKQQKPAQG